MAKAEQIALQSSLGIEECMRRLQDATDPGQRTLFSLSGYKGSKPLHIKFKGNEFKVWKRRYYRNDFSPYFHGTLTAENQGTRIEGHFDMDRWVKLFMRIWLGVALLFSLPALLATIDQPNRGNTLAGIAIPIGLVAFGIVLQKFGRWMGRNEEKYIKEFLETTLLAQPGENEFVVSQRVIGNRPL